MSGLGTGLAPFKAFIEEKIWQKQQGMEIGISICTWDQDTKGRISLW